MNFFRALSKSITEKDVENIYRSEFAKIKDAIITSPLKVDGILEFGKVKCLLEFKHKENFKEKLTQCGVLIQCLYYLKKLEGMGENLPKTIFIGDINECFIVHINSIVKYLSYDVDWSLAPSEAHKKNVAMLQDMIDNEEINPFVFDINEDFQFFEVVNKIKELNENIRHKIRITKYNVVKIYDYFNQYVISGSKLKINEKVNLFIQIIINPKDNYIHPKKKNILATLAYGEVKVNQGHFKAFFEHFEGSIYSPKEKENLTALSDRLIEDLTRRSKGEFYTPTTYATLAHNYINSVFGEDWKEKFVVWDCCWGTGNLTRDYKFRELYCSTLEQSDVDTANQMNYNPEATKFQYDFLNDKNDKLPVKLQKAIKEGKPILFLINPPYASANNMGTEEGDHKAGVAKTGMNKIMLQEGWGKSSQNLYAQFLYRIYKYQEINKNIKIGLFSPPLYLSGGSFKEFRKRFLNNFGFEKGFIFSAGHFSDVSSNWGILFSVWSEKFKDIKGEFICDVFIDEALNKKKTLYNLDELKSCSEWVKKETRLLKTYDVPQLGSYCSIKNKGRGNICKDALGYMNNSSNNVYYNGTGVSLFTSAYSNGHGLSIIDKNFFKVCNVFTARSAIKRGWLNYQDEYIVPNENHSKYEQYTYDAIVYSLFNNKSQQSSLRQVEYKNKLWDIKNEFFWISKEEMIEIAEKNNFDILYQDARTDENRFVYKKLFKEDIYNKISSDAKKILDVATELTKTSMPFRKILVEEKPEYHLSSWDAGYAQLKLVWKDYYEKEFIEFRKLYQKFEERIVPLVYELGFLK